MSKKIVLTGGGSAGHVTPNLALVPGLLEHGIEVHYIGTADGIEHTLVHDIPSVSYTHLSTVKSFSARASLTGSISVTTSSDGRRSAWIA